MKLEFINPRVPNRAISYEAYCPGKQYTANGTRLACRVVLNGEAHLYVWNRGYENPRPLEASSNGQVPMALVIDAFRKLGKISGNAQVEQPIKRVAQPAESEELRELRENMLKMQKQMELMSANMVQQAQLTQSIISMNSITMNINNMEKEYNDIMLQDDSNETGIEFNFNAVEEIEEEDYYEINEDDFDLEIEEIEEEIRVVEQPKRRASNRE